jgi:hypothetical protein
MYVVVERSMLLWTKRASWLSPGQIDRTSQRSSEMKEHAARATLPSTSAVSEDGATESRWSSLGRMGGVDDGIVNCPKIAIC